MCNSLRQSKPNELLHLVWAQRDKRRAKKIGENRNVYKMKEAISSFVNQLFSATCSVETSPLS